MNKQDILLDIKAHQHDINQCISDLVKARINRNENEELNAYERMESLLAKTNQMCSVIIDYLTKKEYIPTDKEKLIDSLLMARNCALQLGCNMQDTVVYNLGKYLDDKLNRIEKHLDKKIQIMEE